MILLQLTFNGLLLGGIYALISIGLTLNFGVVRVINFAPGEFLMLSMYITYFSYTFLGLNPYLSGHRYLPDVSGRHGHRPAHHQAPARGPGLYAGLCHGWALDRTFESGPFSVHRQLTRASICPLPRKPSTWGSFLCLMPSWSSFFRPS